MRIRKFIPPISILLFLALTAAGAYYVRLRILERHMLAAMEMGDGATIGDAGRAFPSPALVRDGHGRTPLHCAAELGDRALVDLLLNKGADVNAEISGGVVSSDYDFCAPQTPLYGAIRCGNMEVVRLLIAKGADINVKDFCRRTPLHWAAYYGKVEAAELLIVQHVDINAKDWVGFTVLKVAKDRKQAAIAELLRKAGAKE